MLATALGVGLSLLAPSFRPPPEGPVRVRYTIQGGEQLEAIAARYGVDGQALRTTNPGKPERGRVLEIEAHRLPAPVQRLRVTSGERDTWATVAQRHTVEGATLRAWNPKAARRKNLRPGTSLVLWIPSGASRYPLPDDTAGFPEVAKPATGESVGRPSRGRLVDGARLPEGPYIIRFGWQAFGSALTVWNLQRVIMAFRAEAGFEGDLYIGAMSQRNGRRLRPHRSHQSGRDVDVRLPAMPHAEGFKLEIDEVDWHATWALIDTFVRTGDVEIIFLERKLRHRLKRAGMALGADDERVSTVMRKIRHSPGHTAHIHVRFRCDDHEERCRAQ